MYMLRWICLYITPCAWLKPTVTQAYSEWIHMGIYVNVCLYRRQNVCDSECAHAEENNCVRVCWSCWVWSWKPGSWQPVCLDLHLSSTTQLQCSAGCLGSLQSHTGTGLHTHIFLYLSLSHSSFPFFPLFPVMLSSSLLPVTFLCNLFISLTRLCFIERQCQVGNIKHFCLDLPKYLCHKPRLHVLSYGPTIVSFVVCHFVPLIRVTICS